MLYSKCMLLVTTGVSKKACFIINEGDGRNLSSWYRVAALV